MNLLLKLVLIAALSLSCRATTSTLSDQSEDAPTGPSASRNITEIRCTDGTGDRELKIKRSENELPFPTYHIEFVFRGQRVSLVSDAPVAINNNRRFMVQKITNIEDRSNIEVSAGVEWSERGVSGFYQEAANGGLSPLPSVQFETCAVREIGRTQTDNGPRNIAKIRCVDDSGDRQVLVTRSLNELPFPTYHIEVIFRGQQFVMVTDAPVSVNDGSRFMVQKVTDLEDRENIEVSAGVDWTSGSPKGFYQEAANNGLSPLPGLHLELCSVTEGH